MGPRHGRLAIIDCISPGFRRFSMAQLTLYHASPSRSATVLWMLEEARAPYDVHMLNLAAGDQLKPDYLAINPLSKVPALKHGDAIITEVAAICAYLADAFPQARLSIPIGDPRRGVYLKWMFFGPSVLEPAITERAFPRKEPPRPGAIGWRDLDTVADVINAALTPGPWLMGEQFTAADVVIGSGVRWGTMFKLVPDRPQFGPYSERIAERAALTRSEAKDKALAAAAGQKS
jgi:glutathione S-transferase